MDLSVKTKIFKQLNLASRHIPQGSTLPRLYYLLEPLLTEGTEQDDLSSIYESLERTHGLQEALLYIIWGLKETSNKAIADKYLSDLLPAESPKDWCPDDLRILMRLLMYRIDTNEHFTRNRSHYDEFVSFVLSVYSELGDTSQFPYDDYTRRMNLYRLMEENSFITTNDVSALTSILGRLNMNSLRDEIEEDFSLLLRDSSTSKLTQKCFSQLMSKLNQGLVLPRVYYLLERLLTEEASSDDLLSMYKCLQKRDLNGIDPLWYIIWSLKCTRNDKLAYEYLTPLLADTYPKDWYPSNRPLLLRMIIVEMDMSESFRDQGNYKTFVRSIALYDTNGYVGKPVNYPHNQYEKRMTLYRHLEECRLISNKSIESLLTVLKELSYNELAEMISTLYEEYLGEETDSNVIKVKKCFEVLVTKLDCQRVLPRVYYLLESLVKEDAKMDDLYSMYLSLCKRDLHGVEPLWYIAWSLNNTFNEKLVNDYLLKEHMSSNPLPSQWMPSDPIMTMRVVIVRMDLSEEFRNRKTYIEFIRSISPQDEYIGIHESFRHEQHAERMNFYRRLENVTLISPENIMTILDGLRNIGEFGLEQKVNRDLHSLLYHHCKVTPVGYYSACQRAQFDKNLLRHSEFELHPPVPRGTPTVSTSTSQTTTPLQQSLTSSTTSSVPPPHPLGGDPVTTSSVPSPHPLAGATSDPPSYQSIVNEYQYHPPTTPVTIKSNDSVPPPLLSVPSVQERIWIDGESGEDVVDLCISKLLSCNAFPDDKSFMKRVAHVMSRYGNPPFHLETDGGIWQVSLFAYNDNLDTRTHACLTTKYATISCVLGINWSTVERRHLAIPMYSAIAARLYLSNFTEAIPPAYEVEEQAAYWWKFYMKKHESSPFMQRSNFIDTVRMMS